MNKWQRPTAERFWEKVNKTTQCWKWTSALDERGYGVFRLRGKDIKAHRYVYTSIYGEIPLGMFVCHRCDNPSCVNPKHLFLGTPADNVHDMMTKGRARFPGAINPRRHDRHHFAKLSELQVQKLRLIGDALTQTRLAELFGMSKQAISAILRRECWRLLSQRQALL